MDTSSAQDEPILPEETGGHDPYAAWRHRDYRLFAVGNLLSSVGLQALDVAMGWEIYQRTRNPLFLGLLGLVEVLPVFLLTFPAGHVADRFERRRILAIAQIFNAMGASALAALTWLQGPTWGIYGVLFLIGVNQAFKNPARSALTPQLVPPEDFKNSVSWNTTANQMASVFGPALGGLIIALHGRSTWVFAFATVTNLLFAGCALLLRTRTAARPAEPASWSTLIAGLRFVRDQKLILASITLDMFAVLLGGATTLLPMFAQDILQVGPRGLGFLRAAPSVGAFCMALTLAYRPPFRRAGRTLLWAVAGFGAATIVFGLSKSFYLSMAMLFVTGALDNISVVIRHTLVQLRTPDELRGRVSAVNSLFIGTSNQLGGFESGVVARMFGPVVSVVSGGIGTLVVVLGIAYIWPQLRDLDEITAA